MFFPDLEGTKSGGERNKAEPVPPLPPQMCKKRGGERVRNPQSTFYSLSVSQLAVGQEEDAFSSPLI